MFVVVTCVELFVLYLFMVVLVCFFVLVCVCVYMHLSVRAPLFVLCTCLHSLYLFVIFASGNCVCLCEYCMC